MRKFFVLGQKVSENFYPTQIKFVLPHIGQKILENFHPRIKILSPRIEKFCPRIKYFRNFCLKIFVCLIMQAMHVW